MENTKPEMGNTTPENKKIIAGLMGILFGAFGIHKFVLGYQQEGIIQLIIGVVTCGIGGIIGFIEGILYLTKSDVSSWKKRMVLKNKIPILFQVLGFFLHLTLFYFVNFFHQYIGFSQCYNYFLIIRNIVKR